MPWLVATVLATLAATGWPTDNRVGRWVDQLGDDPGWALLAEGFGGDEFVLLRVRGAALGDPATRRALREALGELDGAAAVARRLDPWELEHLARAGPLGALLPASDEAVDLPTLGAVRAVRELDLVDADASRVDALLQVREDATPAERESLLRRVDGLRDRARELGLDASAAGHPLVAAALDIEARRVERRFAPALGLLAALVCGALLRSPRLALAALLPAALGSALPRAALRALGIDSDLILVTLGPLGFVLLLASSLHLVVTYRALRAQHDVRESRRLAREAKLRAGLLAAITTAGGFAALALGGLRSVTVLGLTVAATMLVLVPLTLWALPSLLGGSAGAGAAARARPPGTGGRRFERLARASRRRALPLRLAVAAVLAGGVLAFRGLPDETNALHYFPVGHPARAEFLRLEAEGATLSTVEVLVRAGDAAGWSAEALSDPGLEDALAAVPEVRGVVGPRVVRDLPPSLPVAARLAGRVDPTGTWARWTLRVPSFGTEATERLVERVRTVLAERVPEPTPGEPARAYVTGSAPAMLRMHERLLSTLVWSLTLTAAVSGLGFLTVTRRPRELAAALVTNLVPVAVVFCVAGLLRFPLDGATVMVAAVVLGLAVDNTFHLLHAGRGGPDPVRWTAFRHVGRAAWVSSLSLTLGFGALALSGFVPTARFGLLCAVGALAALVADLVVLPALWLDGEPGAGRDPGSDGDPGLGGPRDAPAP